MIKPKLWNYKSGKKKGKLRTKAKQYLSFKLKAYWKFLKSETRLRKQICYNSDYSLSIRAIQINSNATLEELEHALLIFLNQNPTLHYIDWDTEGLEEEEISADEDINLKDGLIYVEFNNRGKQNLITL